MTIHTPIPHLTERATSDEIRDILERQVAAKICHLLPPDENSAQRILAHASAIYDQFISLAAVRAASVEG